MIKVIGFKGISLSSRTIEKFTFGPYSHVEALLDIDSLAGYGAFNKIGGVGFTGPHLHKKNTPYVIWSIEASTEQKDLFFNFLYLQHNKKYDWAGILGFPSFKDNNNPEKWFCSELLTAALYFSKIKFFNWDEVVPGITSPNRFVLSPALYKIKEGKT